MTKTKEELQAEMILLEEKEKEIAKQKRQNQMAIEEIIKNEGKEKEAEYQKATYELLKVFKENPVLLEMVKHERKCEGSSTENAYNNRCTRCYLNEMLEQTNLKSGPESIWEGYLELELKFNEFKFLNLK